MLVLGSPGLGHRLVSFLELRSEVSFSDVVLRPARKLFFSLSETDFGGALSNFETSSTEWRLLFSTIEHEVRKTNSETMPNRFTNSFHFSRVEETFVKLSAICWLA